MEQLNHTAGAGVSDTELAFLEDARVGRLGSVDAAGHPHVVPVCFAMVAGRIYTPLDQKPKRVDVRQLRRVRNVLQHPAVCLVVDRWSEDWSELAWIQVHADAGLVEPDEAAHAAAILALRERYPQYAEMSLETLPVLELVPRRVVSWRV